MKTSISERVFTIINYGILTLVSLITLYPFIYVLSASISSVDAVVTGKVLLFPKGFELSAYREVLSQKGIWTAYANTIFYTVVGTLVNLFVTICGAYPLSKKRLMGRKLISLLVAVTMWFNANAIMIPLYLTLKNLGLINTRLGIIIAFACLAFFVFMLRTYFQSIPESLEESAKIDGANDLVILFKIYLPLSLPALATIGLYYAVNRWNAYFWAMVLLTDEKKIPLQVLLKKIIVEMNVDSEMLSVGDNLPYSKETMIYATIIIATIPMLAVYPYIQKYFIKGVMIGSVKG